MTIKSVAVFISALFLFIQMTHVDSAYAAPLQKVRLKIEGIHEKSLPQKIGSFFCGFTSATDCESQDIPLMLQRIKTALVSVPSVKTAEISVKKKWFFFKNYKEVYAVVEFELGTLTSETLVMAVESASNANNIYKVKFIE